MASNRRGHYFGAEEKPRIEIVPMIDVMMFLLVFFVLIMTQMIQDAGIKLELPQSSTANQLDVVKINVGIDKAGTLYLEGRPTGRASLTETLRRTAKTAKVDVVISGDSMTSYQSIVDVMDLARAAGINAVGLATRTP